MLKILGGFLRGKKVIVSKNSDVRPTMSKSKEALFSSIGSDIEGKKVLDLFGGTASLSFESISRGALLATIIEKDKKTLKDIIQNIETLGISHLCRAYLNRAEVAVEVLARKSREFDIIFLDPPYFYSGYNDLINSILIKGILSKNGRIIIEHHRKSSLSLVDFEVERELKAGKSIITFIKKGVANA